MADGLDQAHINAGLDLLRADAGLAVLDGFVPQGTLPPYVVVYASVERLPGEAGNAVDGVSDVVLTAWYCHAVGANAVAARAVAQRVRTQLLDARPTITGRNCGLIRQESANPPSRDESTGSLVMDALSVYVLRTTG